MDRSISRTGYAPALDGESEMPGTGPLQTRVQPTSVWVGALQLYTVAQRQARMMITWQSDSGMNMKDVYDSEAFIMP